MLPEGSAGVIAVEELRVGEDGEQEILALLGQRGGNRPQGLKRFMPNLKHRSLLVTA